MLIKTGHNTCSYFDLDDSSPYFPDTFLLTSILILSSGVGLHLSLTFDSKIFMCWSSLQCVLRDPRISSSITGIFETNFEKSTNYKFPHSLCIHSFSSLSYDRSKASSKASSPHSAIYSSLFQIRVSSPFLKAIQ